MALAKFDLRGYTPLAPMRYFFLILSLILPLSCFAADCGFDALCSRNQNICTKALALERDVQSLSAMHAASPRSVRAEQLTPLNDGYRALAENFKSALSNKQFIENGHKPLDCLHNHIVDLSLRLIPGRLDEMSVLLRGLENRADQVEKRMDAAGDPVRLSAEFSREINALNMNGSRLWDSLHQASLNADDMNQWWSINIFGHMVAAAPNVKLLPQFNDLEKRLAKLSEKLQRLSARLGHGELTAQQRKQRAWAEQRVKNRLHDPFSKPDREALAVSVWGKMPERTANLPRSAPQPLLLDLRHPPPKNPLPPPRRLGLGLKDRLLAFFGFGSHADFGELNRLVELRSAGRTRTVGDPDGRADLMYGQTGRTCTIAAQVQVLKDSGVVPRDADPTKIEEALIARAAKEGYCDERRCHNGTPTQYLGNLLDMPVAKHYRASVEELDAAVRRGRILIATANAGLLWNDSRFMKSSHAFVITGAETDLASGEILGYYINDTGMGAGVGRWIMTAKHFRKAWKNDGSIFIEPL